MFTQKVLNTTESLDLVSAVCIEGRLSVACSGNVGRELGPKYSARKLENIHYTTCSSQGEEETGIEYLLTKAQSNLQGSGDMSFVKGKRKKVNWIAAQRLSQWAATEAPGSQNWA